jgi:hypothetical protein
MFQILSVLSVKKTKKKIRRGYIAGGRGVGTNETTAKKVWASFFTSRTIFTQKSILYCEDFMQVCNIMQEQR